MNNLQLSEESIFINHSVVNYDSIPNIFNYGSKIKLFQ